MRKIENYSYDINDNGEMTIYFSIDGGTYSLASISDCADMSDEDACKLAEEVLEKYGYYI